MSGVARERPRSSSFGRGRRRLWVVGILVGLALLAALAVWVLGNTRFELDAAAGADGELTVETSFPAATCRKTLSREFPFVRFRCDETVEPGDGAPAEPSPSPAAP